MVLLPTLAKVLLPAAAIAAMLFASHKRGYSFDTHLGFRRPPLGPTLLFFGLWIVLVAAEELASHALGEPAPKLWADNPALIIVLRILAIGVLGPIAEEIAVRGLLFGWLQRTRLGPYGAILVCAVVWSAAHLQYGPLQLGMIVIDGIVLGLARHVTKSIWPPIAMHIAGNLFAIWQALVPS